MGKCKASLMLLLVCALVAQGKLLALPSSKTRQNLNGTQILTAANSFIMQHITRTFLPCAA